MSARPTVTLTLDPISPYVWLALHRLRSDPRGGLAEWVPRPVVFSKLLDHHGLVGPVESPAKRVYTFRDALRCAAAAGLVLEGPPRHPFRTLSASRTALLFEDPAERLAVAFELTDAAWGRGEDLEDWGVLAAAVERAGLAADDLEARATDPRNKARLAECTAAAIDDGVFGIPTFGVDGELFWGHDRMDALFARLDGSAAPFDEDRWRALLVRPAGAQRRR